MISYAPLWNTMKARGETTYTLITHHGIDRRTIYKLKHDENVTTFTLEKLCIALNCSVQDIILITPNQSEDSI